MKNNKEGKPKIFEVRENVYKTHTLFITNCSQAEFVRIAKKYNKHLEEFDDYTCGCVVQDPSGNFFRIVYIQSFDKTAGSLGIISHELFHLVVRICSDKGVRVSVGSDEAAAYLYEFYMFECVKHL